LKQTEMSGMEKLWKSGKLYYLKYKFLRIVVSKISFTQLSYLQKLYTLANFLICNSAEIEYFKLAEQFGTKASIDFERRLIYLAFGV